MNAHQSGRDTCIQGAVRAQASRTTSSGTSGEPASGPKRALVMTRSPADTSGTFWRGRRKSSPIRARGNSGTAKVSPKRARTRATAVSSAAKTNGTRAPCWSNRWQRVSALARASWIGIICIARHAVLQVRLQGRTARATGGGAGKRMHGPGNTAGGCVAAPAHHDYSCCTRAVRVRNVPLAVGYTDVTGLLVQPA